EFSNPEAEKEMSLLMDVIRAVRNIRAEVNVPLGKPIELLLKPTNEVTEGYLQQGQSVITRLTNPEKLEINLALKTPEKAMSAVVSGAEIYLPLAGLIDIEQELARLEKELKKLDAE